MTKVKDVNGLVFLQNKCIKARVTVRTTSDKLGKSLSLAVEEVELMIHIPIEPVSDMVEVKDE